MNTEAQSGQVITVCEAVRNSDGAVHRKWPKKIQLFVIDRSPGAAIGKRHVPRKIIAPLKQKGKRGS